jgi:aldehyde dehydrogenase (NAD+)
VAEATADDVNRAVASAEAAFPSWSALSPIDRGKPLKKLAEKIISSKEELAMLDAVSMGKPIEKCFDAQYAAVHFNYFGEAGYSQVRQHRVSLFIGYLKTGACIYLRIHPAFLPYP